jgi:hypothetical protein
LNTRRKTKTSDVWKTVPVLLPVSADREMTLVPPIENMKNWHNQQFETISSAKKPQRYMTEE